MPTFPAGEDIVANDLVVIGRDGRVHKHELQREQDRRYRELKKLWDKAHGYPVDCEE